jgi:activating signal cointegrator complex subunit 1
VKESRDRDIKTRISSLMLDRDAFREAYNEAMGELRVKEEMIKSLQGQVRGLKSFVSTSSKMDEQVTDEAFGERMQRLGNGLQNWVITNFRRVKIGMLFRLVFMLQIVSLKPVLQSCSSSGANPDDLRGITPH